MRMFSKTFELHRTVNGVYALGYRAKRASLTMNLEQFDELFRFLGPLQEGQQVVWLRDLDGTGSLHPCAPSDPGAVMFVGPPK